MALAVGSGDRVADAAVQFGGDFRVLLPLIWISGREIVVVSRESITVQRSTFNDWW